MKKTLWAGCFAALALGAFGAEQTIVDSSFNPGTGANGFVETVLPLPGGKILICGGFTSYNGVDRPHIARLNSNGSLDTSFNARPDYWVRHMTRQADGKIIIGGFFSSVEGLSRKRIARLNPNGDLDETFDPGTGATGVLGVSITGNPDPFVFFTAVQSDGKVLITGNFTNYNGTTIYGIARLTPTGKLDSTFDVGSGLNTWGRSIQVLSNDKILVTGWFDNYRNAGHHRMALINPSGVDDKSFNPFFGDKTAIYTAALLPNGKYIAAGHSVNELGMFKEDIARLNADGTVDTSFVGSANDKVESIRIQRDGKIVLGGYFSVVDGQPRRSIARLNADGTLDVNFGANVDNFIWSVALDEQGRILVAGGFNNIDGFSRGGVARLLANPGNPGPDPTPGPDTTKPVVQMTLPATGVFRVTSSSLTVAGTARDANGIQNVAVTVDGGGSVVSSTGTTDWSAVLNLAPGTNVVTVRATDPAGNAGTVTRRFFHVASSPLVLTVSGVGTISPNLDGQQLQIGRIYRVTARPGVGQVFKGWTGSIETTAPTISFVLQEGFALQANFIPNPFVPFVGVYNGLFANPDTKLAAQAGSFRLGLTPRGTFSGRLITGGRAFIFRGQLNTALRAQIPIPRPGESTLVLDLQPVNDTIQGLLSDGTFASPLLAYRAPIGRAAVAGSAGRYTFLLPGGATRVASGHGYGSMSIAGSGGVRVQGQLADGTALGLGTTLSSNGMLPVYLRRGASTIYGWVQVAAGSGELTGPLHWERAATASTSNLVQDVNVVGSKYIAPAAGEPPLSLTAPVVLLDNGDLTEAISANFTWGQRNQPSFAEPNVARVRLNISPGTGLLTGSFVDPSTGRTVPFRGVVVKSRNFGGGFFISSGQSGSVFVGNQGGPFIPTN